MGLFSVFYVGFGQWIAAIAPNPLFASLLVPAFFTFTTSFCGVVVPYDSMPYFWKKWMYHLTPFHYLVEGLLGIVTNRIPVRCANNEYARFSPPPNMTCEQYAGSTARQVGGYVGPTENGLCTFCQFSNGNQFAASFNMFYKHVWRDYVGNLSCILRKPC